MDRDEIVGAIVCVRAETLGSDSSDEVPVSTKETRFVVGGRELTNLLGGSWKLN